MESAATSSGRPIILRIDFDAGHGLGSTRGLRDAETADEYAFVRAGAHARAVTAQICA